MAETLFEGKQLTEEDHRDYQSLAVDFPGCVLVYKAHGNEEIIFANKELISLFECDDMDDFMEYTGGSFRNIVYKEDLERVENEIWTQINAQKAEKPESTKVFDDIIDYRILTKNGELKNVGDIGRLVHNERYGDIFYVSLYDNQDNIKSQQIIEILGSQYDCLLYLDLDTLEAHRFKNGGVLGDVPLQNYDSLWKAYSAYVENHVSREMRSDLLRMGELEHIRKNLRNQKTFEKEYMNDENHYCAMRLIKQEPADQPAQHVVIAFNDRDQEVRARIGHNLQDHYDDEVRRVLASEYDSSFYVSIKSGRILSSKVGVANVRYYEIDTSDGPSYYETYSEFVNSRVLDEDKEMMLETGTLEYLSEILQKQKSLQTIFRTDDGEYCVRKVIKTEMDDAEPEHLLVCFVNKDAEIRNQLKVQLERDEYLKEVEAQKALLEEKHEELQAAHEKSKYNSEHDALTGLFNRRMYVKKLRKIKEQDPERVCIINMDVNGLKYVNDNIGHQAGDALILGAGKAITEAFGELGTCYRTGGDEFEAIIVDHEVDEQTLIDTLHERASQWKDVEGEQLAISIGIAIADRDHPMTLDEMQEHADDKMYADKRLFYSKKGNERRSKTNHITKNELSARIQELQATFEVVRVIDLKEHKAIRYDDRGESFFDNVHCYNIWGRSSECTNCVTSKAVADQGRHSKLELVDGKTFFINSQYLTVDGSPMMVEVIHQLDDQNNIPMA